MTGDDDDGWVVRRERADEREGKQVYEYLEDHAIRGGEDILVWSADINKAWTIGKTEAENYATLSFYEAEAVRKNGEKTCRECHRRLPSGGSDGR